MPEYTVYGFLRVGVHKTVTASDPKEAIRKVAKNADGWWFDDGDTPPRIPTNLYVKDFEPGTVK